MESTEARVERYMVRLEEENRKVKVKQINL